MTKSNTLIYLSLIIIFVLALLLRFYRLNINLPELYADETGHYVIRNLVLGHYTSLLSFLYNKLFFGSFSFVWIFGLTPLGVRSASALYASLACLSSFFFAYTISKNKVISLLMSLLIAVLPWNHMIGRLSHTHVVIIALITTIHIGLFMSANTLRTYLISLIPLFLTLLYYPSMAVVVPIATVVVFRYMALRTTNKQKKIILAITITAIILSALFALNYFRILDPKGRALDLAIWRDVNTTFDTDKFRGLSWNSQPTVFSFGLPPERLANKLFLNTITANISVFTKNYLSFFSPDWLFLKGDAILRHSTGLVGAFYPFLIPFMLYGAYKFFQNGDKKAKTIFLVWILMSPVPAAITKDGAGYLLRVVTMLPFLTYFCALGIVESFALFRPKLRLFYGIAVSLIAIYSVWYFFYGYFHIYPAISGRSYETGFKELSDFQVQNNNAPLLVIWDGFYPYGQFLFWQKVPFTEYQKIKLSPIVIGETTFWKTLPNLYFTNPKDTKDVANFINQYHPDYLVFPDRYFVNYSDHLLLLTKDKVGEINYLDKTTAFTIYSIKPTPVELPVLN
jgi:hypothetical protein